MTEQLSYRNTKDVNEIILLHKNILSSSIATIIGHSFIKFYYENALKDNSFFCNVYKHDGKIVGFITFSNNSSGLLFRIIRKKIFQFVYILSTSIIKDPKKLKAILASVYFVLFKQGRILPKTKAEIIAFAVLPEYRHNKLNKDRISVHTDFYKKFRVNIGKELLASALKQLNKMRIKEVKIQADKINKAANRFYLKCGCKLAETRFSFLGSPLHVYKGRVNEVLKKLSK